MKLSQNVKIFLICVLALGVFYIAILFLVDAFRVLGPTKNQAEAIAKEFSIRNRLKNPLVTCREGQRGVARCTLSYEISGDKRILIDIGCSNNPSECWVK